MQIVNKMFWVRWHCRCRGMQVCACQRQLPVPLAGSNAGRLSASGQAHLMT